MKKQYNYKELIGYKIMKGEVLIKRKLLNVFIEKGYAITFEQWTVLNVLFSEPGLIQSEIAQRTYKDKTNVTRILDVLSKNGYIVRKNNEKDRRISCIYLTDAAKKMFNDLIPYIEQTNEQFGKGISENELYLFNDILDRLCKNAE
jgi:DNA-binding MarR family transcriptional regulator